MNLSPTLAQFFSPAGLMTLIKPAEAVKRGTKRVLPADFYEQGSPDYQNPVGTQVGFYRSTNNRDAARLSGQGDPSRAVSLPGTAFITTAGLGGKENYDVLPQMLAALESPIPFQRQQAVMELGRNIQNFYSRFTELRTQAVHSLFANGKIWADTNGALQQSSSSAKYTFDPSIPSTNGITVSTGSTTQIGDWSSASTDIGLKIRTLVQANLLATGYRLTTIYYGLKIPGYLAANTTLQQYFKLNPGFNAKVTLENTIPDGFLGMKWVPVWEAGSSSSNTVSAQFGDNYLAFTPDASGDWWEMIPCGTVVPANGVAQGLVSGAPTETSATANMEIKYGYFNYGSHILDPYTVRVIAGDYFLPALKVPSTFYFGICA